MHFRSDLLTLNEEAYNCCVLDAYEGDVKEDRQDSFIVRRLPAV